MHSGIAPVFFGANIDPVRRLFNFFCFSIRSRQCGGCLFGLSITAEGAAFVKKNIKRRTAPKYAAPLVVITIAPPERPGDSLPFHCLNAVCGILCSLLLTGERVISRGDSKL